MGVFVLLPLLLPLTAVPIARLAERHLHPRVATRLLSALAAVLAVCSTVCLGLLVFVGTVQLPGHPLPDAWADREAPTTAPYEEAAGKGAVVALLAVAVSWSTSARRHRRVRRRAEDALAGVPDGELTVLTDEAAYAYALPGVRSGSAVRGWFTGGRSAHDGMSARHGMSGGRIVVSTAMLACLDADERAALVAHERAHLAGRHHRYLLLVRFAARANPLLMPLRSAVAYATERWADEEAARVTGERRVVARAIGKAALVSRGTPTPTLAGFAAPGPVPRRVAALLEPAPSAVRWPPVFTAVGLAAWAAAAGTLGSALSSANATLTLLLVLKAAGPL
ncbi:M56 family metallopeptidase [Streptomyces sp. NPDC060366]|uniref:M56 family metallopeptidase n=1 Tax=Streptomyces sp. NPDC060366 TaxID=3347105 RepID=UPI003650CA18